MESEKDKKKRASLTDEQIRKAIMRRLGGESREDIALAYHVKYYAHIIGPAPRPEGRKRKKPSKLTDEAKSEIMTLLNFIITPKSHNFMA